MKIRPSFHTLEQGRWGKRKQPVWRITGQWKREQLARVLPDQKEAIVKGAAPDLSKLPPQVPDQVVLLLGQDDLFPYRIEYRRQIPQKDAAPGESASRALVTMDLYEVSLNVPIDPAQFGYQPGETEIVDQTDAFVQSMAGK